MMELKAFYQWICKEFNEGEPLEYKWTRADGYWKVTKGFPMGGRSVSLHSVAEVVEYERWLLKEKDADKRKPGRIKKVVTKYKGEEL
jgi:hypothetical protein